MTVSIHAIKALPTEIRATAYNASTTSTSWISARMALPAKRMSLKRNQIYNSMKNAATITAIIDWERISPLMVEPILEEVMASSSTPKSSSSMALSASRSPSDRERVLKMIWLESSTTCVWMSLLPMASAIFGTI